MCHGGGGGGGRGREGVRAHSRVVWGVPPPRWACTSPPWRVRGRVGEVGGESQGACVSADTRAALSRLAPLSAQHTLTTHTTTLSLPQQSPDALRKSLVLAGLVDAAATSSGASAAAPAHAAGAAVALPPRPAASAAAAWAAAAATDDGPAIDDDALLTEAERAARPAPAACGDDTAPTRKACANCSCGRAEAEAAGGAAAKPTLTQAMLDDPQTNCGSCSLGDAYRCAGCPYRGLPAFEAGKKIELPADFLLADA